MPSTPVFVEFVTATNDTGTVTNSDWKSIADRTTAYSAAPVTAGQASYQKIQTLAFTAGSWNGLSSPRYWIDASTGNDNVGSAFLSVYGATISGFTSPVSTTVDTSGMATTSSGAGSFPANFASTNNPFVAGATSTGGVSTNGIMIQPLRTQLRTNASAAPGDAQSARTVFAGWIEA